MPVLLDKSAELTICLEEYRPSKYPTHEPVSACLLLGATESVFADYLIQASNAKYMNVAI